MGNEAKTVRQLRCIPRQDHEELGGYCESLVIEVDGVEHYVLHEMFTYYDDNFTKIKTKHIKAEFETLGRLEEEFRKIEGIVGRDPSLPWVETDVNCGYNITDDLLENMVKTK